MSKACICCLCTCHRVHTTTGEPLNDKRWLFSLQCLFVLCKRIQMHMSECVAGCLLKQNKRIYKPLWNSQEGTTFTEGLCKKTMQVHFVFQLKAIDIKNIKQNILVPVWLEKCETFLYCPYMWCQLLLCHYCCWYNLSRKLSSNVKMDFHLRCVTL